MWIFAKSNVLTLSFLCILSNYDVIHGVPASNINPGFVAKEEENTPKLPLI